MNRIIVYLSLCSLGLFVICGPAQQSSIEQKVAPSTLEAKVFELKDLPTLEIAPKATSQIFHSDSVMVSWLNMHPDAEIPNTMHWEEEIMIVLEGTVHQILGRKQYDLKPGDVVLLPANLIHGGKAGPNGCRVIDIFYPIRRDYLEKLTAQVKK